MQHTFDIRFARSLGLAAFLEAPANSFRWKGRGRLHIDSRGVSIAGVRDIVSLFMRFRRKHVSALQITHVYREGDALRLEFQTDRQSRASVSCWAENAAAAAEIVQLLPTTRTVEMEHSTTDRAQPSFRLDMRLTAVLLSGALATVALGWWWSERPPAARVASPAAVGPPAVTRPAATPGVIVVPASVFAPQTPVVAPPARLPDDVEPLRFEDLRPGVPAYVPARRRVDYFQAEMEDIQASYRHVRLRLEDGTLTMKDFAASLEKVVAPRWKNVIDMARRDPWLAEPDLLAYRGALLEAATHWRRFLAEYAAGIEADNPAMIERAFTYLAAAELEQRNATNAIP